MNGHLQLSINIKNEVEIRDAIVLLNHLLPAPNVKLGSLKVAKEALLAERKITPSLNGKRIMNVNVTTGPVNITRGAPNMLMAEFMTVFNTITKHGQEEVSIYRLSKALVKAHFNKKDIRKLINRAKAGNLITEPRKEIYVLGSWPQKLQGAKNALSQDKPMTLSELRMLRKNYP